MKRLALLLLISACATTTPKKATVRNVDELVTLEDDKIVVRESITFEHGQSDIAPASTDLLDAVAKILSDNPGILRLIIIGHADATGDPANNPPLSLARAKAVKTYLEGRGIEPVRIEAQGVGAEIPIDSNETDEGRARNRRVEFRVSR